MQKRFWAAILFTGLCVLAAAQSKPRARDLGVPFDGTPGSLNAITDVKGVEVGDGFRVVEQRGTEHRDEIHLDGFTSNHAGGILGGISTGQSIRASIALKPASSILVPGRSVNVRGEETDVRTKGRHDPCVGIRATPIAEAMTALVLMDQALRQRAQCGDVGEIEPKIPGSRKP